MRIIAFALVLAFVATVLAEDIGKGDEPTKEVGDDKKKEVHAHHMTAERKEKLIQHKKRFMKVHPEKKAEEERTHAERELMRSLKDRVVEIKKSDLPKEEKKAKLDNLKREIIETKASIKSTRGKVQRARLTPDQRRALIAQKKSAGAAKGTANGAKRLHLSEKKTHGKINRDGMKAHPRPFPAKRGEMKNMEDH